MKRAMRGPASITFATPGVDELGLEQIANREGLSIGLLPNGAIFSLEHREQNRRILVNQVLASPIAGGLGRLLLRIGGREPALVPCVGAEADCRVGAADDRFVWEGARAGLSHRVVLWLDPHSHLWLWRLSAVNRGDSIVPCDALFVQDLGLGEASFVMNNEAYACQYLDQFVARHARANFVVMSRQNLPQSGAHPWTAHGCLEGAAGYATDLRELMGPAYRDADEPAQPYGATLSSQRLQYETSCAALQSRPVLLAPGSAASWTFFGVYQPDHPAASSDADLAVVGRVERIAARWREREVALAEPARTLLHEAPIAVADRLENASIRARYRRRAQIERRDGEDLSFFAPTGLFNRHIVLREKERLAPRRHGAMLLSGETMAPTEETLCATAWMHGVFGAQLTIGNTAFHKLFSVSRDPYNVMRGNGLRILVDLGEGWRLLSVPSAFEMGLCDCRWLYRLGERTIEVSAQVSSREPAIAWRVAVEGPKCRFLVFGHLVLGELEYANHGRVEIDVSSKRFIFRPDPESLWGQRYPRASYRLVTSSPKEIEAVGGDELLYRDGERRSGGYVAIRTRPTRSFAFAVVGSLTDETRAEALAAKYAKGVDGKALAAESARAWRRITRGVRLKNAGPEAKAVDAILPWLVHDAMIHLAAPHGLEQYSVAAWGTRDVCQGPLELLLALEHDAPAKAILRRLFAQQYEKRGDWPQWFMLEPYSAIQDKEAHGDIIVWPLKALCDYIEATGDFAFLAEPIVWRRDDNFETTAEASPVAAHVATLVARVRERFIPGGHLIRYGAGDWNDSLQPVDPAKRDWMTSSWTVALLYQQLRRYAAILRVVGRKGAAREHEALAAAVRKDFRRHLIRDGVVAGYAEFNPEGQPPTLLLHPSDQATGVAYSLIALTQAIVSGLLTANEARRNAKVIADHLVFPDGAHLMDKPLPYRGGLETIFRRGESAAFFGREIGLMYVHAHLRYAEAMSVLGDKKALWEALLVANPVAVAERLRHASLRQRNAYFSSSDAAFRDRYEASAKWELVKKGEVTVDGGWRIYSSGPGIYVALVVQHALGVKRRFGKRRRAKRALPASQRRLQLAGIPPRR
jgi:cellobiose phosphorylase